MSASPYWDAGIETMPVAALRVLQLQRLREQVARCYETSGFYRERFAAAGIGPADIRSLDDIERVPVVTKEELREEQLAHPPFGRFITVAEEQWIASSAHAFDRPSDGFETEGAAAAPVEADRRECETPNVRQ